MEFLHFVFMDGSQKDIPVDEEQERVVIRKEDVSSGVKYIDFMPRYFTAETGEEGFFFFASIEGSHYSAQTFFRPREDAEEIFPESSMPLYACVRGSWGRLAIVEGMRFEYSIVIGVKNGKYYLYARFTLEGEKPYEDIVVRFLDFKGKDARYQEMAKAYRKYQLENGNCRTLKEKTADRPVLAEYAGTIECRIRLAWKEVPSRVDDQIPGVNEPPVHAELTFQDVDEIIEEFSRQGIEKVNFCLVGWNAGGHDGRFPDLFPVEEKCGTLEELKDLVKRAREKNYMITAHTNLYEAYSVSRRFKRDHVLHKRDGSEHRGGNWGGGKSYLLCPEMAYKHYIDQDMKDLKDLGFYGAHYFDVFSIVVPHPCYHPEHRLTCKEVALWRCRLLEKAQQTMGCIGSEGSWDYTLGTLDYVLYAAFFFRERSAHPMCDEYIPFWNIVYHGIVLYNCFAASVNANIKNDRVLKVMNYAWGGRPLNYVNSRFMTGTNPWGDEDLRFHPRDEFRKNVTLIRKDYDFYQEICHLQYEFIEDYEVLPNGVLKTVYSNGEYMLSNPTETILSAEGKTLAPYSNTVFS